MFGRRDLPAPPVFTGSASLLDEHDDYAFEDMQRPGREKQAKDLEWEHVQMRSDSAVEQMLNDHGNQQLRDVDLEGVALLSDVGIYKVNSLLRQRKSLSGELPASLDYRGLASTVEVLAVTDELFRSIDDVLPRPVKVFCGQFLDPRDLPDEGSIYCDLGYRFGTLDQDEASSYASNARDQLLYLWYGVDREVGKPVIWQLTVSNALWAARGDHCSPELFSRWHGDMNRPLGSSQLIVDRGSRWKIDQVRDDGERMIVHATQQQNE